MNGHAKNRFGDGNVTWEQALVNTRGTLDRETANKRREGQKVGSQPYYACIADEDMDILPGEVVYYDKVVKDNNDQDTLVVLSSVNGLGKEDSKPEDMLANLRFAGIAKHAISYRPGSGGTTYDEVEIQTKGTTSVPATSNMSLGKLVIYDLPKVRDSIPKYIAYHQGKPASKKTMELRTLNPKQDYFRALSHQLLKPSDLKDYDAVKNIQDAFFAHALAMVFMAEVSIAKNKAGVTQVVKRAETLGFTASTRTVEVKGERLRSALANPMKALTMHENTKDEVTPLYKAVMKAQRELIEKIATEFHVFNERIVGRCTKGGDEGEVADIYLF